MRKIYALCTVHHNLVFIFHTSSIKLSLAGHAVLKVIRWALFLSTFPYIIEHVEGDLNFFADMLTLWL